MKAAAKPKRRDVSAPPPPGEAVTGEERDYWRAALRARLRAESGPLAPPGHSRLRELVELFGLDAFDIDVVAALWTAAYSPAWRAEIAAHDAEARYLTVKAVAAAFGHAPRVRLASESPLLAWRFVDEHPLVDGTAALSPDPHLVAWLEGRTELDRALVGKVALLAPRFVLPSWEIAARARRVHEIVTAGKRARVRISGIDAASAWSCAAAIANALGFLALCVQGTRLDDDAHERAVRVQRLAFLDRRVPCWPASGGACAWPAEITPFPIQIVVGSEPLGADDRFCDVDVTLRDPDAAERRQLWLEAARAPTWPAGALDEIAMRYDATGGEIMRVAATDPEDVEAAVTRLHEYTARDLEGLAQRLDCPFAWEDLVLPPSVLERLEDVAFEAGERARLWSQPEALRLYPQGRGLVALLFGPPGTGKTMAAQVIAAALGLQLLRVDISRVLSKWVGETAQHLQKVLSSQCSRRAVLLFDEADALFGKRIEEARQAQDHFINMDIGHLMVALESYTGVVLLATNLRSNLDAAFVRRIRHSIEFPMPDARARAAIWSRVFAALFGSLRATEAEDAIARVARIEASGAQIKNAALSTAFAVRKRGCAVDAKLLGAMLARELAKDGSGMSARELAMTLESAT